ncbi:hypothetical protein [Hymenobacter wooponensis]|uniref:Outer membrane protein beta-barrel domain-containing protein n=1 Tax=Hymenobacter wooponensis TaxID=1525360 RepID=A0A4Z0MV35_9BACT|nr:hypothetical protein [Hymenobacter wooponensis]TGD83176.1 hypothetical protein EU557_05190 [Hymenobacter wooponensis]
MKRYLSLCWIALTGCAVYVPTVPSTPLLKEKGDIEVTAAVRGLTSFEGSAAYSPVSHLLVVGEVAGQSSQGSETRNNATFNYRNSHRQAGLGLGMYRMIGKDKATYFGAIGGVGFARTNIYDASGSVLLPLFGSLVHYEANYTRYYGQLYIAKQSAGRSYGLSLRNTFVSYSKLLRNDEPHPSSNRFFLEPTCFVRIGEGAVQGLGTLGFSIPGHAERQNQDRRNITPTTMLISAGVVVRPQLFWKRNQPQSPE